MSKLYESITEYLDSAIKEEIVWTICIVT
jgi:hypothetical protein